MEKKNSHKKYYLFFYKKKNISHFFATNIKFYDNKTSFILHTPSGTINIVLPLLGYQNISNALAASALVFALKIPLCDIKYGLLKSPVIPGRLESIKLCTNKILINDTYNSNVASMIVAIKILENMSGYKILVISDMEELGEKSILYHRMVGNIIHLSKINYIVSIGEKSYEISKMCINNTHFFEKSKLKKFLKTIILKNNIVKILIKGSRITKMEKIVEYLIEEFKK